MSITQHRYRHRQHRCLCLYCGLFVGFWWVWFHHFLSFVGFCFLFVVFMVVVSDWLCLQTDSFQVMVLSPPRETFIVKEHCLLPAAGPAHRLPVRPLRLRLAQLVRLPVLRGGGAVVLRRPPHLLPHAPVPAAGPRPVHQLAADGESEMIRAAVPRGTGTRFFCFWIKLIRDPLCGICNVNLLNNIPTLSRT